MLGRLTHTASRLLDIRLNEDSGRRSSLPSEDAVYTLDVDVFRELALPSPHDALQKVAGMCGRAIYPLYRYVENTLTEDVENIVLSLHEADPNVLSRNKDPSDLVVHACNASNEGLEGSIEISRKPDSPCMSIPTIIVTPAPPQLREKKCWVPVQNSFFGMRLSVPTHEVLNATHPPMFSKRPRPVRFVRSWTYENGHWCAVMPAPDEQERKGMYSRACGLRRRVVATSLRREKGYDGSNISGTRRK